MEDNTKRREESLFVIDRAYELAREMTQRTRKLPRDLRFTLGDRMLNTTYDILDCLIEARYSRERRPLLARANRLLDRLRFQVRLCSDEKLISRAQYEYLAAKMLEVGRLIGGWTKASET